MYDFSLWSDTGAVLGFAHTLLPIAMPFITYSLPPHTKPRPLTLTNSSFALTAVTGEETQHISKITEQSNENSRFITGVGKVEEERLIILLNLEAIIGLQDEIK